MELHMDHGTSFRKTIKENPDIPVILWGIGYYYSTVRDYIKHSLTVHYIHDKKWENDALSEFDGYAVISLDEMRKLSRCVIIFCLIDREIEEEICKEASRNVPDALTYHMREIIPTNRNLNKEEILDESIEGVYRDFYGNCIEYLTPFSLDNMNIKFFGSNAKIIIGGEVRVANELNIECGNNAAVIIGDKSSFDKTTLCSAYGSIEIGEDCMFSYEVFIRNHDSHFIFDAETGNRINYGRSIKINDHVWIGQNAILLAGFTIGNDSIVGAGSISSSAFPERVVIAGNPARIIREGVTWRRNMTWTENYDNIDQIIYKG